MLRTATTLRNHRQRLASLSEDDGRGWSGRGITSQQAGAAAVAGGVGRQPPQGRRQLRLLTAPVNTDSSGGCEIEEVIRDSQKQKGKNEAAEATNNNMQYQRRRPRRWPRLLPPPPPPVLVSPSPPLDPPTTRSASLAPHTTSRGAEEAVRRPAHLPEVHPSRPRCRFSTVVSLVTGGRRAPRHRRTVLRRARVLDIHQVQRLRSRGAPQPRCIVGTEEDPLAGCAQASSPGEVAVFLLLDANS